MKKSEVDDADLVLYDPTVIFENQILTVHEMADFLKFSSKKLYKMVSCGEIPFKRVGRQIRFHLPEIKEWLKGG